MMTCNAIGGPITSYKHARLGLGTHVLTCVVRLTRRFLRHAKAIAFVRLRWIGLQLSRTSQPRLPITRMLRMLMPYPSSLSYVNGIVLPCMWVYLPHDGGYTVHSASSFPFRLYIQVAQMACDNLLLTCDNLSLFSFSFFFFEWNEPL
jgi:hypothetical protein